MKYLKLSLSLLLIIILFSGSSDFEQNKKFETFLQKEWEYSLSQRPIYATAMGVKGLEKEWIDLSLRAINSRKSHDLETLNNLKIFNPEKLSEDNQLNLRLFEQLTLEKISSSEFNRHLLPFSHRGGVQLAHEDVEVLPLITLEDYQNWLERLKKLDGRIEQTINLAQIGINKGYKAPKVLMERVYRQIQIQTNENTENNPFYKIFKSLPESFSLEEKEMLKSQAKQIIIDQIIPAYKRLEKFFQKKYLPSSRSTVGLYDIPKGKELYRYLAKSYTTTSLTPEEIHQIGLKEVSRIRKEMDKVIKEVGFKGTFKEFLTFLREDQQFYYASPEELFEGYLAVSKRIDPEIVKLFRTLPRTPYGLRPIPIESAPDTTTAYYMSPTPNGSRPGYYYVNLYRPETRPKFEMEVLSVHEAVPGHHLQISLAMEKENLPMFRRVSPYTAFVEGWGLYSESLGYQLGLYKDPYSKFGQLTYDMWRAIRLVVDTGIHYYEWERQEAIDFFMKNAGKSELDIVNEIDRYIVMPGQALAYKIGQMKLLDLRKKANKELDSKFDIRDFHDAVLREGALPLNELELVVERYIHMNK
jgi:prolyl oligopeptidase